MFTRLRILIFLVIVAFLPTFVMGVVWTIKKSHNPVNDLMNIAFFVAFVIVVNVTAVRIAIAKQAATTKQERTS